MLFRSENIVERLVVTTSTLTTETDDLPDHIKNFELGKELTNIESLKSAIDQYEMKILANTMMKVNDTKEMSEILKVDRSTITRKLNKYNIKIQF